jgi:transmembrane 9 superfamily protein 2/4
MGIRLISLFILLNLIFGIESNEKFFEKVKQLGRKNIKLTDFKNIYDTFFYKKTEILKLAVKGLNSYRSQIPYDYTYLNICIPKNISRPKEGITELLTGKRMSYSNYYVFMNQNETCNWACTKNFTEIDVSNYKWLIDNRYYVTYYLDKLASGYLYIFRNKENQIKNKTNYFLGIPIGYKKHKKYYIYNHYVLYITINEKNNKYQVVDFYISAHSVNQSDENTCKEYENGNNSNSSNDTNKINNDNNTDFDLQDKEYNILEDGTKRYYQNAKEQELLLGKTIFTYDVIFLKSNISFSSRYDHYFTTKGNVYRWVGLITSNVIILILTCVIFLILKRTINKYVNKYNNDSVINNNVIIDEFGWKQIAGDVFRAPKHQKTLSALIGTGIEILCLIIISLILTLIGFIKPEIRLNMINNIFICCILFSIISGYVSTFIYRSNGGKEWLKNSIVTALLCPLIALSVLGIIRLLLTFEKSNAGFKISQMALLCLIWLFVSSPLVLAGTFLSLMRNVIKYPCKVNALPTTIEKKPWYLHLQYISWFTGIIPFFTFFIEFIFFMKSFWVYQVYYLASFLVLSLLLSIIITSEMSIIFVFINLCHGDHKWWWKSFFVSASPALYIFLYSIAYFINLRLTRLSAIIIYFLIMGLISLTAALVLGACGTLLTLWFVFYIYSKIKYE